MANANAFFGFNWYLKIIYTQFNKVIKMPFRKFMKTG